ncbi:MAG: hypothetical protein F8N38_10665 [Hungatella sp.]|nr:hypothetical protein [Hungatella sp.]
MNLLYDENTENCLQEPVLMQEIKLVDGILTARIPVLLKEMSDNGKEAYYPYEDRPDMIFADDTGGCQMTFQMIDKKLGPFETGIAAEAVREYISSIYPRNELSPVHLYNGRFQCGWFTMELNEAGESSQHVKAVLSVHNRMLLVTATFPEQDRLKWEAMLKYFFDTLEETA